MSTDPNGDIAARIIASIAALPLDVQHDAIAALIGTALKTMPVQVVHEIRAEILEQLPEDVPIVKATIELIDGHLALREMGLYEEPSSS